MKKEVLIRGVDEETYRRAKATAALSGIPMGAAVNEALEAWAAEAQRTSLERELAANLSFVRSRWDKIKLHKGQVAVVAGGELRGFFGTYDEARGVSSRFRIALTFAVEGEPARHEVEFGPEMAVQ